MKGLVRLILVVLFVGAWALAAAALHVVRVPGTQTQIVVIPKNQLRFEHTYVDTREWTLDDVAQHPDVVRRLIETGKAHHLQHVVGDIDVDALVPELRRALGDNVPEPRRRGRERV
jgi:hypothetical protein